MPLWSCAPLPTSKAAFGTSFLLLQGQDKTVSQKEGSEARTHSAWPSPHRRQPGPQLVAARRNSEDWTGRVVASLTPPRSRTLGKNHRRAQPTRQARPPTAWVPPLPVRSYRKAGEKQGSDLELQRQEGRQCLDKEGSQENSPKIDAQDQGLGKAMSMKHKQGRKNRRGLSPNRLQLGNNPPQRNIHTSTEKHSILGKQT